MKLIDVINSLNLTKEGTESTPNWSDISNQLGVSQLDWSEDTRLKSYYVAPHYCTDSYVGMSAYFLDNEFIAISNQSGRKCDEEFKFISNEAVKKTRNYILSLNEPYQTPPLIDKEFDIGDGYDLEYSGQILIQFHRFAKYKPTGETVEIIGAANDYKRFHLVKIKLANGTIQEDDVRNLRFNYGKCYEFSKIERL